ncbi:MAG: hypothetical protein V3V02_04435 [Rhizobiaceae bacterium]
MKKNTKTTGRSRKTVRHAKSQKKPVTIDLTAEKVEPKETTKPAPPKANTVKTKTSVPKSTRPKHIAEAAAKGKKPSEPIVDSEPADFGTTTKPSSASKSKEQPTPKSPTPKAIPKTIKQPSNNGLVGKLAAGIIGGAVALGGAGGLQYLGVLSSPNSIGSASGDTISSAALSTTREELLARISGLETRLKETTAPVLDMDAINTSIESKIKQLAPQDNAEINSTAATSLKNISGQIEATNGKLETLQSQLLVTDKTVDALKSAISTGGAGEAAGLATLNKTVAALQAKLDSVAATAQTLAVNSNQREEAIAQLQKSGTAPLASDGTAAPAVSDELQATLSTLETKLSALAATAQSLAVSSNEREAAIGDLQKLVAGNSNDKQDEMAKTIAALQTKLAAVASTTQSLATSANESVEAIASLEKQSQQTATMNKQSANAIAAAALKNDIDQGLPFAASLNRLKSIAGENKALSALDAYAGKGVPTVAQLTEQFSAVGDNIISALAPKPKEDFVSRLFAGAKSLVKVRSIKPQTGSSPAALVSQITAGLTSGSLSQSTKAWQTLPKAGQEVSASWHEGLKARIIADSLVADTLQSFLLTNAGN